MTRKDYINIAGAFQATNARINNEDALSAAAIERLELQLKGVRRLAAALADFLADDNPRFEKERFLKACGYSGEVRATQPPIYEECGCCGHYHRPEYRGDCRNDAERFTAGELDEKHGENGWEPRDLDDYIIDGEGEVRPMTDAERELYN